MKNVFSAERVREAESALMASLPADTLMQRAAYGIAVDVADILKSMRGRVSGSTVVGFIGAGNNGSDALWAMTLLVARGVRVIAVDVTSQRHRTHVDDAFAHVGGQWWSLNEITRIGEYVDVVLDGIAGLQSRRPVEREVLRVIDSLRRSATVVAVDIPSGLIPDTGQPAASGGSVVADVTIALGVLKPCHVIDPGADLCGELRLVDIGLGPSIGRASMVLMSDSDAAVFFDQPGIKDHKYSRGVVGVVAGSKAYPGAGILAAKAARWGGAGMVNLISKFGAGEIPSVVNLAEIPANSKITGWVVGPGSGSAAMSAMNKVLKQDKPVVLDADALNALALEKPLRSLVKRRSGITVLTPHGGEARRLADAYSIDVSLPAVEFAQALAAASNAVVYLKGSIGIIATPKGFVIATHRTCEHLATAGSGDVIAGFLASMLAHHQPRKKKAAAQIVAAAVIVHSLAAELVAIDGEPVIADDIEENLPAAIAQLTSD